MGLRAVRTFDRKLGDREVELDAALDGILLARRLPLPPEPRRSEALDAALADLEDELSSAGDVFLARVQQEGHRLLDRDLADFTAAGIDTSEVHRNPSDPASRAMSTWHEKLALLIDGTGSEVIRQGRLAQQYDESWRDGWDLRVHSPDPVRKVGRSGRGVLISVGSLCHANLLGIAVGMVNLERVQNVAQIAR